MRILRPETLAEARTRLRFLRTHLRTSVIVGLVVIIWLVPIAFAATWIHTRASSHVPAATPTATGAPAIAAEIARQSRTTPPRYDFTAPTGSSASIPIVGTFALYYAAHGRSALLGAPLTPAYPIAGGWVQFFTSGALVLPSQQASGSASTLAFGNPSQPSFADGVRDLLTGIIRLPLALPLLRAGSLVAVAGAGTPSYAELRHDAIPITLAPAHHSSSAPASGAGEPSFAYQQDGHSLTGEIIPQPIWQFMNRADIAPDGWKTDVGLPLTPPLSVTLGESDGVHQLQLQYFFHAALVEDDGVQGTASVPRVSALPTGVAYLQTLGPPPAMTSNATQVWVTGNATVLDAPGSGRQQAQLGLNFPVILTGGTRWIGNNLWYAIHWNGLKASGDGWLAAAALSFTSPGATAPIWSDFETLSPALASYLSSLGGDTGAAVYDETHHRYYTYNAGSEFTMASSSKVPIMITFLEMTEAQHRQPNGNEMSLLTTMIEQSDNDSAEALWLEEGGAGSVAAMMRGLGISGLQPDYDGEWGYSTVAPLAMVQLLTALHDGRVLNTQDRALALNLMSQIESDQQTGVGNTAPRGASYWMKDGWVTAPNGLWATNSSGIVTLGGETYIIAVYSQNKVSINDGWGIAEHVCGAVAQLLT